MAPVRATPIALLGPSQPEILGGRWALNRREPKLSSGAAAVAAVLSGHGASFFDELVDATRLLPVQVEEALAELVALGLANSDSFAGLRALLLPADRRRAPRRAVVAAACRCSAWPTRDAGPGCAAWPPATREAVTEHVVRTLLKRWGVLCWQLSRVEARLAAALARTRRLPAPARSTRRDPRRPLHRRACPASSTRCPRRSGRCARCVASRSATQDVSLSAVDPLNLTGILTAGARVPALTGNRVLYRDGLPVATLISGEVRFLVEMDAAARWQAQNALIRRPAAAAPSLMCLRNVYLHCVRSRCRPATYAFHGDRSECRCVIG